MGKILLISFLFSNLLFANSFVLVSDLDDTLKITNGGNKPSMIFNAIARTKIFAGMADLYKELMPKMEKSYLLSASPTVLIRSVKRLTKKHKLKFNQIYLRKTKELFQKRKFKLNRLERIVNKTKGKLILLGDNQSIDDEIYLEVKRRYPNRVHSIFIHKIKDLPVKTGIISYITAVDLVLHLSRIIGADAKENLVSKITKLKKLKRFVPKFAFCPKTPWLDDVESEKLVKFQGKINAYCKR